MNPKYLVLYLVVGTVALGLAVYQGITTYPAIYYVAISIFFYYLAYKTYHEKKDNELM